MALPALAFATLTLQKSVAVTMLSSGAAVASGLATVATNGQDDEKKLKQSLGCLSDIHYLCNKNNTYGDY